MNFVISYSGGKDSALALYRMIEQGHTPVAMIATVNVKQSRSWSHGMAKEMLLAASKKLNIPLLFAECEMDNYAQVFEKCLKEARQKGADACVFGDIDIEAHREWNEARCQEVGLDCILPLWQESREALVYEMLEVGFRTIIKVIDGSKIEDSFLGQDLTIPLVLKLKETGVDPCGENGEYHTFVYDGPIFSEPIPVKVKEIKDIGVYKSIDITLAR